MWLEALKREQHPQKNPTRFTCCSDDNARKKEKNQEKMKFVEKNTRERAYRNESGDYFFPEFFR